MLGLNLLWIKRNVDKEIPAVNGLVITTVLNTKIGKIEDKTSDMSGLVKKPDYNAKISDIESKYFTTSDYNKFTSKILEIKIKVRGLVDKSDISGFIDNSDSDKKVATLTTKSELKNVESILSWISRKGWRRWRKKYLMIDHIC